MVAAHAFVIGGAAGGGERAAHLVEEYARRRPRRSPPPPATWPSATSTGPSASPAPYPIHYCGSPLQLDFGEDEQAKQVNVVEAEPGIRAKVTALPPAGRRPVGR